MWRSLHEVVAPGPAGHGGDGGHLGTLDLARDAAAARYETTFRGLWHCRDQGPVAPARDARVEPWRRGMDPLLKWLTALGVMHAHATEANPSHTVSDAEDDCYVRLVLLSGDREPARQPRTPRRGRVSHGP